MKKKKGKETCYLKMVVPVAVGLGQSFLPNLNDVDYLGIHFYLHFHPPLYEYDHVKSENKIYPGYMTNFQMLSLSHNCLYRIHQWM